LTRECDDEGCDGLAVDTAVENDGADYDGAGGCCAAAAAVGVAVVVELADDVDVVLTDTVGSDLGDDVDEKEVHGMVAADGCTVPAPVAEERTETGSKMRLVVMTTVGAVHRSLMWASGTSMVLLVVMGVGK